MQTESSFPFWGIDGCKGGWICFGTDAAGKNWRAHAVADIAEAGKVLRSLGCELALIDIPIGFCGDESERICDLLARQFIAPLTSSVFRAPCRQAVEKFASEGLAAARAESERVSGKALAKQTWGIVGKMAEVDSYLRGGGGDADFLREMHPEVCFRALRGSMVRYNKKNPQGREERLDILTWRVSAARDWFVDSANHIATKLPRGVKVADDDVIDAMAGAFSARLAGDSKGLRTLPDVPPKDSRGLPMEMAFFVDE